MKNILPIVGLLCALARVEAAPIMDINWNETAYRQFTLDLSVDPPTVGAFQIFGPVITQATFFVNDGQWSFNSSDVSLPTLLHLFSPGDHTVTFHYVDEFGFAQVSDTYNVAINHIPDGGSTLGLVALALLPMGMITHRLKRKL